MSGEWVAARDAQLWCAMNGSSATARTDLLDWASSGELEVRGRIEGRSDPELIESRHWQTAPIQARWTSGRFVLWIGGRERIVAGVEFNRAQLELLRPERSGSAGHETQKKNAGGAPRKQAWNDWIAALAVQVHEGEVGPGMTATAALGAIADMMAQWGIDEMPRATVQPAINAVIERLNKQLDEK